MTHCTTAGTPVGVSDPALLCGLSAGLEDCGELIADLGQALDG
jgi:cystathionine beta-lyase/cystathionine gamma-synthase